MNDRETNFEELKQLVRDFRRERNWDKHFTPKDTAISIALEAAELLEHYQWDDLMAENKDEIAGELADILIFAFHFATLYDFDIATIMQQKLEKASKKYPSELFQGDTNKEAYHRIKQDYRQKGVA